MPHAIDLTGIFCRLDDFCCHANWHNVLPNPQRRRNRQCGLSISEVMTILVYFHLSNYRTFKHFYLKCISAHYLQDFPKLPSYQRFVEMTPTALTALCGYLSAHRGSPTGIAFVDSTPLDVCSTFRISSHKVFKGLATRGKSSTGWFFGFKLHVIVNHCGELLAVKLTPANVDDRKPVPEMAQGILGKLFGDRGYISHPLFEQLWEQGLQLVTRVKKNMKNKLLPLFDKLMLRKRALIESVFDCLKNQCQIEHSRHRSPTNFMVNLVAGLVAYTFMSRHPSLNIGLALLDYPG